VEEIEVKYRLAGPEALAALRARLVALGAQSAGAAAETSVLFDTPDGRLRAADQVLRLRWRDGRREALLTYKGPARWQAGLKRREEHTVAVADGEGLATILACLGFTAQQRYTRQRELWRYAGAEVALDTLAFGTYCEVEGSADAIAAVVAALDLSPAQLEPRPYPALAAEQPPGEP
jgi:adenylate cyclase class 2